LSEWAAFLDQPVPAGSALRNASRPLAEVIADRAWRLYRRIVRAAGRVDERTTPARLHELRILAKKLRYLIDVAPASHAANDLEFLVGALKNLQRVLGAVHDSHVQQRRLREYCRAFASRGECQDAVIAIGRLSEENMQPRASLRAEAVKALARFRSRDTRAAGRRALRRRDSGQRQP
jgi:CHAD domain-containing protein